MKLINLLIALLMGLNILCSGIILMKGISQEMELFIVFVITMSIAIMVLALKPNEN